MAQLQAAFLDNWIVATGKILLGPDYFPDLEPAGNLSMQSILSSPAEGQKRIRKLLLLAFSSAQDHIRIATAFMYPDPIIKSALVEARERGVEVDILAPAGNIPEQFVRFASRNRWGKLLEADVRIHEYDKSPYHAKLLIIDDQWVSFGSANLDNRSFRINDELNVNVYDKDFTQQMIVLFEEDISNSKTYDVERWKKRPWSERVRGVMGNIIGWHL